MCGLSPLLSVEAQPSLVKVPPLEWTFSENLCAVLGYKMKNVAKEMMERLDCIRCFIQYRAVDEIQRGVGRSGASMTFCPRPVQWKSHNGEVLSSHTTAGPASLWKNCNTAPHIDSLSLSQHRCMLLTGHNELNLLRYGGPQFVWGVTAIGSLVLCKVPIIGYHKGPRILLFHQPGV